PVATPAVATAAIGNAVAVATSTTVGAATEEGRILPLAYSPTASKPPSNTSSATATTHAGSRKYGEDDSPSASGASFMWPVSTPGVTQPSRKRHVRPNFRPKRSRL